jgi:hypothetical protein
MKKFPVLTYNKLGNTDLIISRLGFGLMRLPLSANNPDFSYSDKLIRFALQRGINFFDIGTFYCHGHCEEAFGRAIKKGHPENLIYSGKNSSHQSQSLPWKEQLEKTLEIFGVNKLDIYFIHYLDWETFNNWFIKNKLLSQIEEAKRNGYFRYLGFSSHDSPQNIKLLIDTQLFDTVVLQYNLLDLQYEQTISYANSKGLGVIIMNPFAGGLLTKPENFSCNGYDYTDIRKTALHFVSANPNVHCILSGMGNIHEMDENLHLLSDGSFDKSNFTEVLSWIDEVKKTNRVVCTNCNYCLPCTQGINIPGIIEIYNKYGFLHIKDTFSREYTLLESDAGCCIGCGICESRCPNKIGIIKIMQETAERFIS